MLPKLPSWIQGVLLLREGEGKRKRGGKEKGEGNGGRDGDGQGGYSAPLAEA